MRDNADTLRFKKEKEGGPHCLFVILEISRCIWTNTVPIQKMRKRGRGERGQGEGGHILMLWLSSLRVVLKILKTNQFY